MAYWVAGAAVVGLIGGSIISSNAAGDAADTQAAAAGQGIDETRRQFDELKKILAPYVQAGTEAMGGLAPYVDAGKPALEQQLALLGLRGEEAQKAAIRAIEGGSLYKEIAKQGEDALLQNASATGGLRGGNIQAALAQFRPQLLSEAINTQYGRLGGMTALGQQTGLNIAQLGQASAAGQASAGMQTAANISSLLGKAGEAEAAGTLAQAKIWGDLLSRFGGLAGSFIKK